MPIKACGECGHPVSSDAVLCPRCGKARPGGVTTPTRVLVILLPVIIAGIALYAVLSSNA